jgi:hypothetical protein
VVEGVVVCPVEEAAKAKFINEVVARTVKTIKQIPETLSFIQTPICLFSKKYL